MASTCAAIPGPEDALSPLTASLWADMIMRYWRHAQARTPDAPPALELLDVLPRRPGAARLLLRALLEQAGHAFAHGGFSLRYLACSADPVLPAAWQDAPELRPWIERGLIAPLQWDFDRGPPRRPAEGGGAAWQPHGPVVVLARQAWRRLEQRLFAVHYGELLEADLEAMAVPPPSAPALWAPARDRPWGPTLDATIEAARENLNSAPLPLPIGAIRAIDALAEHASHGFLLLAMDEGLASEQALRLCGFAAIESGYRRHRTLPVNFHLLGAHLRQAGASVCQRGLGPSRVAQIALKACAGQDPQQALDHVTLPMAHALAVDTEALVHAMRTVASHGDSEQALALLRHAHHDPCVLAAAGPLLHQRLLARPACDRPAWAEALARVWSNHTAAPDEYPLHRDLVPAAMRVDAWSLARQVLERCKALQDPHADILVQLAWCDVRTGRLPRARNLIDQALVLDAQHAQAREVHRRLQARSMGWDTGWRRCLPHPSQPLVLEPLDVEHAPALLHQYRDPQIAVMTGLPALDALDGARRWVQETTREPGRQCYAVMHGDDGLVGYVSLHLSPPAANFCFWIGVDHQGRGLATQAGRLLCDLARQRGVRWIFASAFSDNRRSIRALERIGFARLDVRPADAADRRTFLCRTGTDAAPDEAADELAAYLRRENTDVRLVPGEHAGASAEESTS